MKLILLLIFAALATASTHIRLAHLAYDTSALNVVVDNSTVATQIPYNTITPYYSTNAGPLHIVLEGSENNTVLYNETLTFLDNEYYTLFASGYNGTLSPVLVKDDNSAPADQYSARLRLFQGVSNVATTAQILANGNVVATLAYKASAYVALAAGTYTIAFQPTGSPSPANHTQITLTGGQVSTLAFSGLISDVLNVHSADVDYTYFSYRVAHLSPDVSGVDVYFHSGTGVSTMVVANVGFKTITHYESFAALTGTNYTAVVNVANSINDTLTSSPLEITGKALTLSLVGLVSSGSTTPFHISYLADNNTAPASSWTNNVRFYVAIPGTATFSLLLNNQPLFTNVAYDKVPTYQAVQTGTYTISLTSDGDQIATADVQIIGGGIYTIIAEGLIGTNSTQKPSLIVNQDAAYTYFTVRATHAAPGVAQATFVLRDVHGTDVHNFGAITYGAFSNYNLLPLQPFVLNVQSGGNTIYNQPITFDTGNVVTLGLFGTADSISVAALADANTAPSASTKVRARFVNAVVNGATVDVKFNGANQFTNVAFKQASGYSEVAAGTYTIDVFVGETHILHSNQTLTGGVVYTIVGEGIVAPNTTVPVTAAIKADQTYQYFKLRVNHAASNAGPVDILLDNGQTSTTIFSDLQYKQSTTASDYTELVLPNANVIFKVTPHGAPNNVIYSVTPGFVAGSQYTATLYGLVGNVSTHLTAFISTDVNIAPPDSATGRLRFLHAIAGSPKIDVYFNDKLIFGNATYGQLIDYKNVPASGNYRIDLYIAEDNSHIFTYNNYQLAGGQDTLIVAMGTPADIIIVPYVYVRYTYFRIRFVNTSPDVKSVSVQLEDQLIFSNVSFGIITQWLEFTSDKQNLAVIADGDTLIQRNQPFTVDAGNTVVLVGLKEPQTNNTTPLDLIVDIKQPTVTGGTVAAIRVFHVSPNTPAIDLKFNDTNQFTDIIYKQISDYKEIAAGTYDLAVWSKTFNDSLVRQNISFAGGSAYTIFVEGEVGKLELGHSIDYVPPNTGSIRFLHASPNTEAVDLLVDGSSDFKNVAFEGGSDYNSYADGTHNIRVVPTDKTFPNIIDGQVSVAQGTWKTVILIGLQKTNETTNETAPLEAWEITDQHDLPAAGDVSVRFIHASPNAPSLDLRLNGQLTFPAVVYKNLTEYHVVSASFVSVELFETGKTDALLTSKFDLSVPAGQSAIYTLVAEGLYGKDLKVVSFLDNGPTPPVEPSPSKSGPHGLSGAAIGGIVAGCVVAVIAVVAIGYIVYRRKKRAGYSEIATSEHSA